MREPSIPKAAILKLMAEHADLLISTKARLEGMGYTLTPEFFLDIFTKNPNVRVFGRQYDYRRWARMTPDMMEDRFIDLFFLKNTPSQTKGGPGSN